MALKEKVALVTTGGTKQTVRLSLRLALTIVYIPVKCLMENYRTLVIYIYRHKLYTDILLIHHIRTLSRQDFVNERRCVR